jgi:hypothetical protein
MKKSHFLTTVLVLAVFLAIPGRPSGAQIEKSALLPGGTVNAGNTFYNVYVEDISGWGQGVYTATTGPAHPSGSNLNVLYGHGWPGTSFNTIRSYTTGTDYVQSLGKSSANTVIWLDPYAIPVIPIANGFRTTYILPGPPTTPDALIIHSDVKVNGTTYLLSNIEVSTTIINTSESPVDIGVRYLWDFQIGLDDGPTFQAFNPNGPVLTTEAEFMYPAFESYIIEDNDTNTSPPTMNIFGTVTGQAPGMFSATPPDLLKFVYWGYSFATAFEYTVNPALDISTVWGYNDCAVLHFFGHDWANRITIDACEGEHTVSAALFLTPPICAVYMDIKPGSCPNPLNVNNNGVLPVAILGTEDFDVTTIDPASIQLEGVAPLRWDYEDSATPFEGELCDCHNLDGDGYLDLNLKYDVQEIAAALGSINDGEVLILTATGNLKEEFGGAPINGQDCVVILKKGNN